MKPNFVLALLCYALLAGVFILDLYTPQLFIASILLNVPIALSSLALRRRLTIGLVVSAEIANVIAAYANGVAAGHRWDAIAIGDRLLLAASFVLIGYMSVQTQRLAHSAGLSDARAELVDRERRLRIAFENIRASLSVEFVLHAVVREALRFFDGDRAMLILDAGAALQPRWYAAHKGESEIRPSVQTLSPEVRSFLARDWPVAKMFEIETTDTIARHALMQLGARHVLAAPIGGNGGRNVLLLARAGDPAWAHEDERMAQGFADQATVALGQANLFARLEDQAREIASQHEKVVERTNVIRDIVYALAHDLRTPLAAANVTIRQAQAGAYGELPEPYRNVLNTTLRSNEALQRLVETLLVVARYESGEMSIVREPVDLRDIAQRVADEFQAVARDKSVALGVEGDTAVALGDKGELRRAVVNLVANALTATPSQGRVTICTATRGVDTFIEVDDTGYGVPPERRASLFQRFGAGAERQPGTGTGLGLYIVRRIIEAHGGRVRYEPLAERGSRFSLEVPAATALAQERTT